MYSLCLEHCIFFDLSKAFDTMPHRGLISALSRIGVSGSLLRWFTSYLSDRRQQVVVDGSTSASSLVRSGVPQGSILGPLLFSIYIDPITSLSLSSTSKILLYADDMQMTSSYTNQFSVRKMKLPYYRILTSL